MRLRLKESAWFPRRIPRSTVAGRSEYTAFRRWVTAFPCCRFRNSPIAIAYNRLLETRKGAGGSFRQTENGRRVPRRQSSCSEYLSYTRFASPRGLTVLGKPLPEKL